MQSSTLRAESGMQAAVLALSIEKSVLLKALAHVQSVVERRNTIPVLGNVKLDAMGGKLRLTATDMDIALVETVDANVSLEGSTTTQAHMLYDIVRKLPDGDAVTLELLEDGARLSIRCGRSNFSLPCLPVDDFPVMEEGSFHHSFQIAATECAELIEKTRFAISTEETRYYLNGIYLHVSQNDGNPVLRAVATDGHRLARMEVSVPAGAEDMSGVILPRKTVGELKKILDESDKEVKIELSEAKVRFTVGSVTLISKLIDGTFPDYERVIPKNNDKVLEIEAKKLTQAVDRVSTISTDKTRAVKMHLQQGAIQLVADSADNGDAKEVVEANYTADAMEIGYNARYLMEMLSQIEGESVQFVLADATAPTLVRDPANINALYVVMPMRV